MDDKTGVTHSLNHLEEIDDLFQPIEGAFCPSPKRGGMHDENLVGEIYKDIPVVEFNRADVLVGVGYSDRASVRLLRESQIFRRRFFYDPRSPFPFLTSLRLPLSTVECRHTFLAELMDRKT